MPEEFIFKNQNDWKTFALIALIARAQEEGLITDIPKCKQGEPYSVSVVINDVEVPFSLIFDRLEESWDDTVNRAALRLLEEKLTGEQSKIFDLFQDFQHGIKKHLREAGMEVNEYD